MGSGGHAVHEEVHDITSGIPTVLLAGSDFLGREYPYSQLPVNLAAMFQGLVVHIKCVGWGVSHKERCWKG